MNIEKSGKWFDAIKPPDNLKPGGDPGGYLGRMMGTGDNMQRQFLATPRNQSHNHKPKQTTNQPKQPIQLSSKPKTQKAANSTGVVPTIDIDDVNWIADRKKKFPKTAGAQPKCDTISVSENNLNEYPNTPTTASSSTATATSIGKLGATTSSGPKPAKGKNNTVQANKHNNSIRKKTLFEKLMEMDQ